MQNTEITPNDELGAIGKNIGQDNGNTNKLSKVAGCILCIAFLVLLLVTLSGMVSIFVLNRQHETG